LFFSKVAILAPLFISLIGSSLVVTWSLYWQPWQGNGGLSRQWVLYLTLYIIAIPSIILAFIFSRAIASVAAVDMAFEKGQKKLITRDEGLFKLRHLSAFLKHL
jgi:hypothetical protein